MSEPASDRTCGACSYHDRIDRVLAERQRDEDRDVDWYRSRNRFAEESSQHEGHVRDSVQPSPAAARDSEPSRDSPVDEITSRRDDRDNRECQPSLMAVRSQFDPDCGQRESVARSGRWVSARASDCRERGLSILRSPWPNALQLNSYARKNFPHDSGRQPRPFMPRRCDGGGDGGALLRWP